MTRFKNLNDLRAFMVFKGSIAGFVSGAVLIANLGLAKIVQAEEWINPNGWPTPNIANAKFLGKKQKDLIKEIPGPETLLKGYKNPDGTYFNELILNGKTYGFYVDTNKKMPMEYMLMDTNGNGIFDRKVGAEGYGDTPKWLLSATYNK